MVGNNNHCYFYRNLGPGDPGGHATGWRWDDAVAVQAAGVDIELFNPCFAVADIDDDGIIGASDAMFALNYLFLEGREPPSPFPDPAPDPTPDELVCRP